MEHIQDFDMLDGIAILRIAGHCSFEVAVQRAEAAIPEARAGSRDLLIDCLQIDGFAPPSIPARHEMVRQWRPPPKVGCGLPS